MRRCPLPIAATLLAALPAIADEPPEALPSVVEPASPMPAASPSRLTMHGFADVYYAFNFNRPVDGASFTPGVGSTAKRANEFSLNLASFSLSYAPEPIGAELALIYGTGAETIHGGEPIGTGIGSDVWRYIARASVTAKVGDLSVEAGIYPSHIGFETLYSKDNWTYTRGWLAENSPWYSAGIKVGYALTEHLSAQLHVYNGWQIIGENNEAKSIGTQVAWTSDTVNLYLNGHFGPETANDNDHWRFFGDFVGQVNLTARISLAVQLDAGLQQRPDADAIAWEAVAVFVRAAITDRVAVAARGELFHDPDGAITGVGQTALEGTLAVELKLHDNFNLKLEGRYDHSDAAIFAKHDTATDEKPLTTNDQVLAVVGAVASF